MCEKSISEIFDSLTDEQKHCAYYMIGCALEGKRTYRNSKEMAAYKSMTDEQLELVSKLVEKAKEEKTDV